MLHGKGCFSFWKVSIFRISSKKNHNTVRPIEPNLSCLQFFSWTIPEVASMFRIGFL
ncbi:hypothetical protein LEP1GSC062_0304 [Leptospira alexanderi serovar Manhao 3 str. L 60]|uniref:Uncharacterized protein n=1 Tax=Leptospira alexanderi serovar Manhao 3 str. L 60 TaxID=1049759 RepID=V6HSA2_9LEPT|nr:hypothetical protein LEP1GSC062_0304 [Leptospira alexanderi serovar Manhao 3 str. L 60]